MPLVACPKCATNLKIPDGSSGNVKCPKCNTIFAVGATAPPPAFEVVDTPAPPPPPKPAPKPAALEPDFEVVDEPKPKKKVTAVADDDDDDRPRSKRRRDDDDDDDYDDRPRRKKKRRRDYDDEDDDWRPTSSRGAYGAAKVGMLLVSISLWLYIGTFAILTLFLLIAWLGASIPDGLMILAGLLGLANWVVGLIGLGFCIAGPSKSRGMAIAATAVAVVHLVMCFVVANNSKSVNLFTATIPIVSMFNKAERFMDLQKRIQKETDPTKRRELEREASEMFGEKDRGSLGVLVGAGRDRDGPSESDMRWGDLATLLPFPDILIAMLAYDSKGFSDQVLGLLSGLVEVARLILLILLIGAVGYAVRDHDVSEKSTVATIAAGVGVVAAMVILVIVRVIMEESKPSKPSTEKITLGPLNWLIAGEIIVYLIHLGTLLLPALMAMQASSSAGRRR